MQDLTPVVPPSLLTTTTSQATSVLCLPKHFFFLLSAFGLGLSSKFFFYERFRFGGDAVPAMDFFAKVQAKAKEVADDFSDQTAETPEQIAEHKRQLTKSVAQTIKEVSRSNLHPELAVA